MKSRLFFLFFFLIVTYISFSQQRVARHSSGIVTIYSGANPFNDAYVAAVPGDTLYLPGGPIPSPPTINKRLTIIGAGHYPDSTTATQKTVIGNIVIQQDADKLFLEGIELGAITITLNHKVDSMIITKCKFTSINFQGSTSPCMGVLIKNCVISGDGSFGNTNGLIFSNNIIDGRILSLNNAGISNNIFFYNAISVSAGFSDVDNCLISNNIFFRNYSGATYIYSNSELNTFANNIFNVVPNIGSNTFINNYNSVNLTSLFVNQTGNIFNYAHDYHLVNPDTYLGNDGNKVGIYGGLYPYKEGAVPQNPHIQFKIIGTQTNTNGELNIQFKVKAQN
ncbi:hypothetical protein EGI22_07115 [Lacihabitans sp. LS3-19]|uniref:right-handed parallel beta-helix repeat-containing protein n=1 Tax=Lacihabitans sp. LS3-19 TaxID=2487335 RepID=UPI0020CD3E51|nr:right-handed parallel beta-helix repeat-containing protein [Lacihabitans sp. LS3-19]MCP9767677.1 hypothetical protein [Lacihabitans sp. LS3-19]